MPNSLQAVPRDLKAAIQQAIEIELSTIPIYLYTYYSINRVPDQNKIIADLTNRFIDRGLPTDQAAQRAQDVSVQIMVHANKAGATIMSVAVEEMLHMALACNLKRALVGMPKLVGKSPSQYPAQLRGHQPGLEIPLRGFGLAQLDVFKQIELPEQPKALLRAEPDPTRDWTSLGELYGWISAQITDNVTPPDFEQFKDEPQLGPNQGYYATNNVNTLYYDAEHKPRFTNRDADPKNPHGNVGDLIRIVDVKSALAAIDIIVEQGEGHVEKKGTGKDAGRPWQKYGDHTVDQEESHYQKYCQLYDELKDMLSEEGQLQDFSLLDYFVKPVPENPTTAGYPADIQTVSNLLNAVYTYLYMMTEACYRQEIPKQKEIFNFGMHKGMIFILSTLCDYITSLPLPWGGVAGPTFENYEFAPATSAKSQLVALFNKIPAALNPSQNVLARIQTLPDMDIVTKKVLSFA
ncbi:hypothetical protein E5K00_18645 [Hymenobacter aquaticus]|uniref:Iminophenyl-pyruvate dimer synthase domain-containing protein n=1 Tax=Hymenobacter aquaticus TaxID=1867101 RepID=A0A4Z0PX29_9BACT|nr:ferritin-like domain-containing protein [Hymenobacter aquaticus]TGE22267.1 hypothetical protein E5K00_18645 [Hymenobacter aquaticus]